MLTNSELGKMGRLGNQMFQFASVYALSKKLGVDFFLFDRSGDGYSEYESMNDLEKMNVKSVENCKWIRSIDEYVSLYKENIIARFMEPHFHFSEEFTNIKDGTDLHGYFQTEKYFSEHRNDLRQIFKPLTTSSKFAEYMEFIETNKVFSVHVRRGDYMNRTHYHTNLADTHYYLKAVSEVKMMHPDAKLLVFSDDIAFCKEYFEKYFDEYPEDFHYISGTDSVEDIRLQSLCFGNIIANSSFSWWGAYLNENNRVIAPVQWFVGDGPKDTQDIYLSNWSVI